jgi:type IV pilus assembly protein PilM
MKLSFLPAKDLVVGVDIGSHSVKVCQLKRADKGYSVVTAGIARLPEGVVDDGALNEPEVVAAAIKELFKQLKIKKKKVGFSISGYSVIVKKIQVTVMEPDEMESHIMEEAEQYVPFDLDDIYLDFQDLVTATEEDEKTDVMLVAAKKEVVDEYLEMLAGIGLQATVVDIDGFALENTYEYNAGEKRNVALIDIGASKININILANGVSVVARDIVVGSGQLTEQIMRKCDLEFEEAESIKLGHTPVEKHKKTVEEIFTSVCTQWILEIKKSLDLYQANYPDQPLEKILLSGGGSKVSGLDAYIHAETGVAVELFNPFGNMVSVDKKIDPSYLDTVAPEMAIATGIAIRPTPV